MRSQHPAARESDRHVQARKTVRPQAVVLANSLVVACVAAVAHGAEASPEKRCRKLWHEVGTADAGGEEGLGTE